MGLDVVRIKKGMCVHCRYVELFMSHTLGCPKMILIDPRLNKYILSNEGQ